MTLRRAAKVDDNQDAIVKALRSVHVAVEIVGKPLDLSVCVKGKSGLWETFYVEVKNPDGKDRITKEQAEFLERWPGRVEIVRSPDEAIRKVLGEEHCR